MAIRNAARTRDRQPGTTGAYDSSVQLIDGRAVYSATDLVGFLACSHRLALERAALAGLVKKPIRDDPTIELIAKRGLAHEARYLEDLRASGRDVVLIERDGSSASDGDALRDAAAVTDAAMRAGADVIYQATFFDGTWRGHADFLLRVATPSELGPWSYEVADTKLARRVKAGAILQICSYVAQLAPIQGVAPALLHVALGGSERATASYRVADFMAYFRRVRDEFEAAVSANPPVYPVVATYPEPVEHCGVCRWSIHCQAQRRRDDDLSLVAGISAGQRRALKDRGVATRRGLAGLELPISPKLPRVSQASLARVREQARIQVEGEDAGSRTLRAPRPRTRCRRRARAGSRLPGAAAAVAGRPVLRHRGRPVRVRRRDRVPVRRPRAGAAGPGAAGRAGVPRDLEPGRSRRRWAGGGEAGVRGTGRPDRRPPGARPGAARLPLRSLRADRPGPACPAPRHARARGRPPASGRRPRRPLSRGPAGPPGGRGELLDQAPGAALRPGA